MGKKEIERKLKAILARMRAGTATDTDVYEYKQLKFLMLTKV